MRIKTARIRPIHIAKNNCRNNLTLILTHMFTLMSIHMVILSTPILTVTHILTPMPTRTLSIAMMGTKRLIMPIGYVILLRHPDN